ncbi:hypothetical protein H112_08956 [Trichophyton rubrum D6]|uniref:SigF-like NTF2-like domain-containing protein n=3 Tax=Trichophyton TaxID=5550 RepID=F2SCX3_TRIRC|nr:uncharacterized protein TERG_01501 [Trichophyton rubrum CBS 118892]EZF09667.1 hypothetical protein H100_08979 [Trichophyton rubrum MR850]EZF36593.1 hypothetical protein H102_08937 [Trichophyton rubrum CBS 100081]EZF47174.1 hypothetical protein H103_08960 [Trichophyton rubrum CBS 288.86]EZF57856.1 hypothetical protein H104_08908 [Trichophyton rubrum CBS 289.86]EZF79146.1 hypothetical protein H110_08960 [Trichophyton rubrum MR1448]EZF89763.1 hypothetical protein H113_09025 [Trichophyton rubr
MENPVEEIPQVIHLLTQSIPSVQQQTVEKYFTPSASITHPFLHSGSFQGSRWLISRIFLFYKIMSPHVDLQVKSVAFDRDNLLLYVTVSQVFRIFIVPFYTAPVTLTTVLQLVKGVEQDSPAQHRHKVPVVELTNSNTDLLASSTSIPAEEYASTTVEPCSSTKPLYYIASQNDLYQTNEYVKFVIPYGIGEAFVLFWHAFATLFCVLASYVFWPIAWAEEKGILQVTRFDSTLHKAKQN